VRDVRGLFCAVEWRVNVIAISDMMSLWLVSAIHACIQVCVYILSLRRALFIAWPLNFFFFFFFCEIRSVLHNLF
jgi:hypothetical protein